MLPCECRVRTPWPAGEVPASGAPEAPATGEPEPCRRSAGPFSAPAIHGLDGSGRKNERWKPGGGSERRRRGIGLRFCPRRQRPELPIQPRFQPCHVLPRPVRRPGRFIRLSILAEAVCGNRSSERMASSNRSASADAAGITSVPHAAFFATFSCHPPFFCFDHRPGGHDQVQPTPRPAGSRSESPPLTRGAVARTFLFL